MNYDPNLVNCGRMADQTVEITFGCWDSKITMITTVGGNCLGFTIIESAIENIYDTLNMNSDNVVYIILKDDNGDTLECSDDEDRGSDWLKDMVISASIIDIKEVI